MIDRCFTSCSIIFRWHGEDVNYWWRVVCSVLGKEGDLYYAGADPEIFQRGGWGGKFRKKKWLLIHVPTRVHIKTRQTCKSFCLLPFQEDCLLFLALFYYSLLIFEIWKGGGGCNARNPPPQIRQMMSCHTFVALSGADARLLQRNLSNISYSPIDECRRIFAEAVKRDLRFLLVLVEITLLLAISHTTSKHRHNLRNECLPLLQTALTSNSWGACFNREAWWN